MGIRQEQRERDKSKIASEVSRRATPPALKQSTLLIQHGSRKKPNHSNNNPPGKTSHITSAKSWVDFDIPLPPPTLQGDLSC